MTEDRMAFWENLGHQGGEDFLRSLVERVLAQFMDFEVMNRIGAAKHERTEGRETQRNGYRARALHTRLGTLDLRVPKLRQGTYFPAFLEPRRLTEQALTAVIQEAWIGGLSTRKVDDLVQALGMTGISKSQVSALCRDIDERVGSFLNRPIEGEWPYLWLDATYLKVRQGGRVVSIAAIIACGVNQDGRREILGLGLGESEAQVSGSSSCGACGSGGSVVSNSSSPTPTKA
jgi:putative transposase